MTWRNSPGQNPGRGSLSLLQGIFQPRDRTQVSCIAGGFFLRGEGWSFPSSFAQAQSDMVGEKEGGRLAGFSGRPRAHSPTRDLRDGVCCFCSPVPGPGDGDRSQPRLQSGRGGACARVFLGGAGCTAEVQELGPPRGLSWAQKPPKIPGSFPQPSSLLCQSLKYLPLSK